MAPYVSHSLQLLLFGYLFSLLLFLLELETLRRSLKLLFVDDEEMAGASFREIRLGQDVLHTSDRAHITFVIDVLQLVSLIWLVDNSVTFLEVNQFASLVLVVTV